MTIAFDSWEAFVKAARALCEAAALCDNSQAVIEELNKQLAYSQEQYEVCVDKKVELLNRVEQLKADLRNNQSVIDCLKADLKIERDEVVSLNKANLCLRQENGKLRNHPSYDFIPKYIEFIKYMCELYPNVVRTFFITKYPNKITQIKALRDLLPLGLKETKEFIEGVPLPIDSTEKEQQ